MGGQVVCEDEDIVHVNDDVSSENEVTKKVVHHVLEGGRGVGEPKKHKGRLEEAAVRDEGSLPYVPFFHANVFKAPTDI